MLFIHLGHLISKITFYETIGDNFHMQLRFFNIFFQFGICEVIFFSDPLSLQVNDLMGLNACLFVLVINHL